jgi:hypothetical protein
MSNSTRPPDVALVQMFDEFVKARMLDRPGSSIEDEQARLVAASQRLLRNQFFRQFVVEFRKPHLRKKQTLLRYQARSANAMQAAKLF